MTIIDITLYALAAIGLISLIGGGFKVITKGIAKVKAVYARGQAIVQAVEAEATVKHTVAAPPAPTPAA